MEYTVLLLRFFDGSVLCNMLITYISYLSASFYAVQDMSLL